MNLSTGPLTLRQIMAYHKRYFNLNGVERNRNLLKRLGLSPENFGSLAKKFALEENDLMRSYNFLVSGGDLDTKINLDPESLTATNQLAKLFEDV